ncbi:MAG: DEAD/DEAH box helicase family protein [Candidatus Nanopelagicales bacterium]|nr:DEAD/DEAH box helicase family protein [Candidatus Nanopelagicales bacterium]
MNSSSPTLVDGQPLVGWTPVGGLRAWQVDALSQYEVNQPTDFLATATPGAGKTTFALTLAARLKQRRAIDRIIVVAPTDHLRTQWADAASACGLLLDPTLKNTGSKLRSDVDGYVTTYAQVAAHPMLHRARTETRRSLVILDEIHHAGDSLSWGEAVFEAFAPAKRRLSLTGTPFRTDPTERIPFVRYEDNSDGDLESIADFSYGYRQALADAVVRPVFFAAYAGTSRWMNSAGEVLSASLSDPASRAAEDAAWRTALDPNGDWVPHVLAAVDDRISHLRANGIPDAAGLILAPDQDSARAYAKIAKKITGEAPVVILSDDPRASKKIEAFDKGTQRMAICVRMVSEGVDIVRACALGFLTSYRTPLFFAQAVGRVVRARATHETATVFLPAVRPLLELAARLEEERNHIVRLAGPADAGLDEMSIERLVGDSVGEFTALDAQAEFAHVLHGGRAVVANVTAEEEEYLGIPGLLDAEQTAVLLASRDGDARKRASTASLDVSSQAPNQPQSWRDAKETRVAINQLVRELASRTATPHAEIHIELRRAVPGPASASASLDTLVARYEYLLARTL